ncbi:MAG: phospholipase D-like domain-containing protein [Candidatus Eiseniibacteriota bacterium]
MRALPPFVLCLPFRFRLPLPLASFAMVAVLGALASLVAPAAGVPIRDLHQNTTSGVPQNPYAVGTTVTVTGVVISPDGIFSPTNNEVQVRDTTGAITVFRSGGVGTYDYDLGDSVTVTGQIAHFNGLTEISNATLDTKHSTGNFGLLDPIVLTCKQVRDSTFDFNTFREDRESQLIRINNVTVTSGIWPAVCGGANVSLVITDATANLTLFIDRDSPVCGSPNPSGPFDVIGILSQFDNTAPFVTGYELKPRFISDVMPLTPGPNFIGIPQAVNVDSVSADITWETDTPSTGIVEYGLTTAYGSLAGDSTAVAEHTIHLAGLTPNRLYHFRVVSCDGEGCRQSGDFTFVTPSSVPGQLNVYFNTSVDASLANPDVASGDVDLQQRVIDFINRATFSLDCAFYSFNAPPVTDALIAKWNAGVKIRLVMDAENSQAQADRLRAIGVPVITSTYGGNHSSGGIMHHKFCIVDGRDANTGNDWLWTGSTNTTTAQLLTDPNNSLEIQDFGVAQAYGVEFNEMWGSSTDTPEAALSKMGNRKTDNSPHFLTVNGIPVEIYFAPSDAVESKYVNYVNTANYGISFSILAFTSDPIADAMRARYSAIPGFYVRGVFDNGNANGTGSEYPEMKGLGGGSPWVPAADVFTDTEPGIHHHKYMIIDEGRTASDPILITGSYNWSNSANTINDENSIIFHDQRIANLFVQEFKARYAAAGGAANFPVGVPAGPLSGFAFAAPYPNPSTGRSAVTFSVTVPSNAPAGARVAVKLYSVAGRALRTLHEGPATPGEVRASWDGLDDVGRTVPPGIYLARATVAGAHLDRKLVVIE